MLLLICGRNSSHFASHTLFSPLTTNITDDGDGSKQVDPYLTLYKMSKSHSLKVSSNHSLFFIPVFLRENCLNRQKVLSRVTPVTFNSSFFLFKTYNHYQSRKYFNLPIFVHHQLMSFVGKRGVKKFNFFIFQDKKAAWFRLGQ